MTPTTNDPTRRHQETHDPDDLEGCGISTDGRSKVIPDPYHLDRYQRFSHYRVEEGNPELVLEEGERAGTYAIYIVGVLTGAACIGLVRWVAPTLRTDPLVAGAGLAAVLAARPLRRAARAVFGD